MTLRFFKAPIPMSCLAAVLMGMIPAAGQNRPSIATAAVLEDHYPQQRTDFPGGVVGLPHLVYSTINGFQPLRLDLYPIRRGRVKKPNSGIQFSSKMLTGGAASPTAYISPVISSGINPGAEEIQSQNRNLSFLSFLDDTHLRARALAPEPRGDDIWQASAVHTFTRRNGRAP
jgi:hypothetical protein